MRLHLVAVLERLMRLAAARPDPRYAPEPRALDEGLWTIDRRSSFLGIRNPCACTLVRLDSGDLVLIGAPSFFDPRRSEVRGLGRIVAVVAPNSFHHSFVREVLAGLPATLLAVAPGLPARLGSLPPAVELLPGSPPPWGAGLDYIVFGPVDAVSEVIFFHPSTRTLVLTDLAFNVHEFDTVLQRRLARAYGIAPRFGPSRNARVLLAVDRGLSRRTLRSALEWPFERILVAHGSPVDRNARERFAEAFSEFL
jgi:hypothetical protein